MDSNQFLDLGYMIKVINLRIKHHPNNLDIGGLFNLFHVVPSTLCFNIATEPLSHYVSAISGPELRWSPILVLSKLTTT